MATSFFEVTNQNDRIQIDDTYQNLVFIRKFPLSDLFPDNSYNQSVLYTPQENELCIAVDYDSAEGIVPYIEPCIDGYRITVAINLLSCGVVWSRSASGGEYIKDVVKNIYVYTFGKDALTSVGTCGLEVRNSEGRIIFSSNKKYLKPLSLLTKDGTYEITDSSKKLAISYFGQYLCHLKVNIPGIGALPTYDCLIAIPNAYSTPTTIVIAPVYKIWGAGASASDNDVFYDNFAAMLIDVTNL